MVSTAITISGDVTGDVTGDPPNVAQGDLDVTADSGLATATNPQWEISQDPASGTATIDEDTGEWTYTVDPAFFDDLDNGEIVSDSFEVMVTTTVVDIFGIETVVTDTQMIDITIEGVCFTAGTRIDTPDGVRRIENLRVGEKVLTADSGPQPIRWLESSHLDPDRLKENPTMRPVRISAGSLGPGIPKRDLLVSQQHRILISGPKVEILFGAPEVLVAAKHLCSWPGIQIDMSDEPVTYLHILLDQHEILTAEGAQAESLFLGDEALHSLSSDALQELADIFPDRPTQRHIGFGRAARLILKEFEVLALA